MPLVDLGPVKKKDNLVDLGPAPTPIMESIKDVDYTESAEINPLTGKPRKVFEAPTEYLRTQEVPEVLGEIEKPYAKSLYSLEPYDPSQPPTPGQVESPYGILLKSYGQILSGLGIPFERISKAVAAPAWKLFQTATPDIKRQMIKGIIEQQATANTIGLGAEAKKKELERLRLLFPELKEKVKRPAAKELPATFKNAAKALVPLPGMTKDTESVAQIASKYYEEMTGEKPPFWYGGAMDYASTIASLHGVQRAASFVAGFAKWAKGKPKAQIRPARAEVNRALKLRAKGKPEEWERVIRKYGFAQAAEPRPIPTPAEKVQVRDFGKYPIARPIKTPPTVGKLAPEQAIQPRKPAEGLELPPKALEAQPVEAPAKDKRGQAPPAKVEKKPTIQELHEKKSWELTKAQYLKTHIISSKTKPESLLKWHVRGIKEALSEGKPVPRAVLEEYKSEKWAQEALAKGEHGPFWKPEFDKPQTLADVQKLIEDWKLIVAKNPTKSNKMALQGWQERLVKMEALKEKPEAKIEGKRRMKEIEYTGFSGKSLKAKSYLEYKDYKIIKEHKGAYNIVDKNNKTVSVYAGINGAKGRIDKLVTKAKIAQPPAQVKGRPREAGFVDLTPIAKAGEQVAVKAQKAHKVLTRFTGLESQIRKSLIGLEEESRRIPRQAAKESIKKYGKLSNAESRAILNHLDNPKKYPDLPDKLKPYAEQVRAEQKETKAIMNELGYGADWPKGRISYLKEKLQDTTNPAKKQQIKDAIEELEGLEYVHHAYKDISVPRKIIRAMAAKRKISKRPSGLLGRKYPTLDIAEKAGKKVAHLAVAQADMLSIARRAQQNKLLIDAITKNKELALPEKKAPDDWVGLDSRVFPSSQKTVPYTDKAGKAHIRTIRYKYHPAIAEAVEELAYVSKKHPLFKAYDKVNTTLKHILFYNPVVMSKNDMFQAWRATGTGFLWNIPKAFYNVAKQTPQYHEFRKAGLYNNVIDFTPAAKHLAENMLNAIRKSKGQRVAEHLARYINPYNIARDFKWLNDRTTWKMDEVMRTATAQSMTRPRSRWKKMGMSNFEVIELANDFLANYGKVPKHTRQILNRAIFTPTYKVSMARVLGKMWASPKKYWPQLSRHYAYKMFVWYVLPGLVGLWVYGDWKAGRSEKGYKIVLKHPRTGRETVYSLSDPLLEEAKVSQRPILQTLEYNLAAVPHLIKNLLSRPYYRNQRDKYGHLFKLGTPIMKDVYNMTDKDKTTAERILTQLAIAYVYHRKGKPQDKETAIKAAARAMSIWTDWKEQKTDIQRRLGTRKQAGTRRKRVEREKRMLRSKR